MSPEPLHDTAVADHYRAKAAAVETLIAGASAEEWSGASPCEGWNAADVVNHLVQTQRAFLREHDLDPGSPGPEDPGGQWREHTRHVATLLDDPQVGARAFDGYFGPTTVGETMAQFYGWDMLVHRWDLGMALGRDPRLSEAELDEIERDLPMFGEALYAPGICAPPVEVDSSASHLERVMARLGRDARVATRP